ncbi:DUF2800 domain-containing protein [Propionimicrobium sp. BV2F7]|uniref:DUF2800 domain-containing protein n=1 Tax=Propionimicrobium sp. BV2F7 TaxID=1111131 RepID=UPI0003D79ACC|nr:DUF2800 domain-containing protein [Propionimicrobium sp. BV2F7]ETJ98230.1 PF10926 family protein [Propionimicrobium sp. BV2F7]
MAPASHAVLSASSAHRWLRCPPSALACAGKPDVASDAALQGTAAHELAEWKLRRALHQDPSIRPVSDWQDTEMEEATDDYVSFIQEQVAKARTSGGQPLVLVEQRVDFSHLVPEGFGTADCIIVADRVLSVVDLKYGVGILVEAENNPQLMLYGLGALRLFDSLYDIEQVTLTIFQPRRESVSTWQLSVAELNEWASGTLRPQAVLAAEGAGEYRAGDWCQFCKIAPTCRARAEANLALARHEFAKPATLDNTEIAEVLAKIPDLTCWAGDVQDYALARALAGESFEGFKLVEGRSIRRYTNEKAVAQAASDAGFTDIYKRSLLPITGMEKLMGKRKFAETIGKYVTKPAGKPTLVPASDKRPELTRSSAAHDFKKSN